MAAPPMDPLYEQRLRDEVIYLHSLWHQGPPRVAASISNPPAARHHHLQPSQATQFKKVKSQKPKKSANTPINTATGSHSSPGPEWAVPSPPPPPPTEGWPSVEAKPDPQPQKLCPEKQSKLAAKHAHQHALKAATEFFKYKNADDDSDSTDGSGDEEDHLMDEDDGSEYSFFVKVFDQDNELRGYYEKNFVKGEFSCLVCGAVGGKKMWKKYKGCLALVQHSITIAKTKNRRAHKAFGQAVCKVLEWDINELSSIVSLLSDKPGETQENGSGDKKESSMAIVDNVVSTEDDVECKNGKTVPESGSLAIVDNVVSIEGDIVEGKNDEAVLESGFIGTGILPGGDEGDMNALMCTDADKSLEDVSMGIGSGDKKESSLANVDNVLTVEAENDKAVPESGAVGAEIVLNSDGDMNSLSRTDADKSLEDIGMVHPSNIQEPAAEGLTNNALMCTDADKSLDDVSMGIGTGDKKESLLANVDTFLTVQAENNDKVVPERGAVFAEIVLNSDGDMNSLSCSDADKSLEDIGMVHPCNIQEPAAEGLTNSSLMGHDADRDLENIGMVLPHHLE